MLHVSCNTVGLAIAGHEERLETFLREGQNDGLIEREADPAVMARVLYSFAQGMRVLGKVGQSREQARLMVNAALAGVR